MNNRILKSLHHRTHFIRKNAAREIARQSSPDPLFLSELVKAAEKLPALIMEEVKGHSPEFSQKRHRMLMEEEEQLFEALCRFENHPTLIDEIKKIADQLVECAADPDGDNDDESHASRYASQLLRRLGIPQGLISKVSSILETGHISKYISDSLVEALASTGGPEAIKALEAELARAKQGIPWSSVEHLEATIKMAKAR